MFGECFCLNCQVRLLGWLSPGSFFCSIRNKKTWEFSNELRRSEKLEERRSWRTTAWLCRVCRIPRRVTFLFEVFIIPKPTRDLNPAYAHSRSTRSISTWDTTSKVLSISTLTTSRNTSHHLVYLDHRWDLVSSTRIMPLIVTDWRSWEVLTGDLEDHPRHLAIWVRQALA